MILDTEMNSKNSILYLLSTQTMCSTGLDDFNNKRCLYSVFNLLNFKKIFFSQNRPINESEPIF